MAEVAFSVTRNREAKRHGRIMHYRSSHRILLVGEGDFSFSASLARAFGSAHNMVATSLDSKDDLLSKYPTAEANVKLLRDLGCMVLNGIDAHTMSKHPKLKEEEFDRIVFNFPHAGLLFPEARQIQINLHQELMKGFFMSASSMLTSNGQIHVTHKTSYPYNLWALEDLAKEAGLSLLEEAAFKKQDYPGYNQKRAYGRDCNGSFPLGACATFKFVHTLDHFELDYYEPDRAMILAEEYMKKMEQSKQWRRLGIFLSRGAMFYGKNYKWRRLPWHCHVFKRKFVWGNAEPLPPYFLSW